MNTLYPQHQDDTAGKPPADAPAIRLHRVCRGFDGVPTLRNISLDIQPGEIFVIMGPSGAGKTVLLKHIIGLMEPDSGRIEVGGYRSGTRECAEQIPMALVFQNGGLLNSLTVEENVGLYLREHRLKPEEKIREIIAAELRQLNLSESDARKYPYELSGGMKKRVAIARAIVMEPKVVLYDEPTSELDPVMARTVFEAICRVHDRHRQTTVIVTHERKLAFAVADRIAILMEGAVLKVGTPEEIQQSDDPMISNFITVDYKKRRLTNE